MGGGTNSNFDLLSLRAVNKLLTANSALVTNLERNYLIIGRPLAVFPSKNWREDPGAKQVTQPTFDPLTPTALTWL